MTEQNKFQKEDKEADLPNCSCSADPFASLPPDQQPEKKSWKSTFQKVTCKGCGNEFWTNTEHAYCHDCR